MRARKTSIAIIGMQGRFPGARSLEVFWKNLCAGVESVTELSTEQMAAAGVPEKIYSLPSYVNAATILDDIDLFDAEFFGFSPREVKLTDPQHRLFIECAWESLENAGYEPESFTGNIGVFGGCELSNYLYLIHRHIDELPYLDGMQLMITNEKDYFATKVAYKLGLTGPAVTVQTSCSTSLVTVCLACQSLLDRSSDIALAGGCTIKIPQRRGYLHTPGGIYSPDGRCRPFDASAQGTIVGSGVGIVTLKRLDDALRDRDTIHAVIRGFGNNNDGSRKIGYTAPSVEGQAQAISMAHQMASVDPRTISYVEGHGTATMLGDPIEVSALSRAFQKKTSDTQFCALGSVKGNVGHLGCAAGVTGLIKTVLSLENEKIPPSINYRFPSPGIDFRKSPFYVNGTLAAWQTNGSPRRAGVSAFGVGGTNAHLVLEQAPTQSKVGPSRPYQLLLLSARSEEALTKYSHAYARLLMTRNPAEFPDIAYTSKVGRRAFTHRRFVLVDTNNPAGAAIALLTRDQKRTRTFHCQIPERPVVFMFSGQGAQYPNMGRELYGNEPVFRSAFQKCVDLFKSEAGCDIRRAVFPRQGYEASAAKRLKQTVFTQPALFTVEYALAQLWLSWGVKPKAMIGHSIGEYVAAVIAGVISLTDAVRLVGRRAALTNSMPPGRMMVVPLPERKLRPMLPNSISIAVVNAPSMTVVAGPLDAMDRFERDLKADKVSTTRLITSHAFHSAMMDPILDPFVKAFEEVELKAPTIEIISNVTGNMLSAEAATDPGYWAMHLRSAVRFGDCIATSLRIRNSVLLEVGPGQSLCQLAGLQAGSAKEHPVIASMGGHRKTIEETRFLIDALGQLWAQGVAVDWTGFYARERRWRVPLPTYPFEKNSYWIGGLEDPSQSPKDLSVGTIEDWCYRPVWKPKDVSPPAQQSDERRRCLFLADGKGVGSRLARRLTAHGWDVLMVRHGAAFKQTGTRAFLIRADKDEDYARVIRSFRQEQGPFTHVVNLWNLNQTNGQATITAFWKAQPWAFHRPIRLARALSKHNGTGIVKMIAATWQNQNVLGDESVNPCPSTLLGVLKVLAQEYGNLRCSVVDLEAVCGKPKDLQKVAERLESELDHPKMDPSVAWRKDSRYVLDYERIKLDPCERVPVLRDKGVYVITGGLGHIGLEVAEMLATTVRARLVLVGRSAFPDRAQWADILDNTNGVSESVRSKIQRIEAIERLGADVRVESADVSERAQLAAVFQSTRQHYARIDGVFHAAGNLSAEAFASLNETTPQIARSQFLSKAQGTIVLDQVLGSDELDFVVLLSSISTVLGGIGLGAYAAANHFLDTFAHHRNRACSTPWITIDWDRWSLPNQPQPEEAIVASDGIEILRRILACRMRHVVVSKSDLNTRIAQWVSPDRLPAVGGSKSDQKNVSSKQSRPNLTNQYVVPGTDVEKIVAEVWEELLGLAPVGIHDKFFELGGDSLLAIQMAQELEARFGRSIPVERVFESPTVAKLAIEIIECIEEETGPQVKGNNKIEPAPPATTDPVLVNSDSTVPDQKFTDCVPLDTTKQGFLDMYDGVSHQLDSTAFGKFAYFLNYGYVSDGSVEFSSVKLDESMLNRNSVKLALEVIGDYKVDGKTVLDVGCGRGGTAYIMTRFFKPACVIGLDLSGEAIAFCKSTHKDSILTFHQGDAENLPFEADTFDAVINIESSHTYPHIQRFYDGVRHVLKPGGHFLYADLLPVSKMNQCSELLREMGFVIERERDITVNVLKSCDQIASSRMGAFDEDQARWSNFLAAPGSDVYESMRLGEWTYRILKLSHG